MRYVTVVLVWQPDHPPPLEGPVIMLALPAPSQRLSCCADADACHIPGLLDRHCKHGHVHTPAIVCL